MPKVKKSRARLLKKFGIKAPLKKKKKRLSKKETENKEEADAEIDSKKVTKGENLQSVVDKSDAKNDATKSNKESDLPKDNSGEEEQPKR
jgi:hypothetical protein